MRLKKLDIRGFGCLQGSVDLELPPGHVALILEPNQSGKSTLAAAVLAALYGVRSDRRRARGSLVEQELYRPWAGGAYGITLTLELDGEELRIDRDLERGSVRVLSGGDDVTDRFQQGSRTAVGELLTGLSREQFTMSAFVGQGDIVWNDPGQLTEVLQRVADSQSAGSTAAEATQKLRDALDGYEGLTLTRGKVDTEIKRCEKLLAEHGRDLEDLEQERQDLADKLDTLQRAPLEQRRRTARREVLRLRRLLHELVEVERRLAADLALRERIGSHEGQLVAREELLGRDSDAVARVFALEQQLEGARTILRRLKAEAEEADAQQRSSRAARERLSLRRRPRDDDVDRLSRADARWSDAQRTSLQLERQLEAQTRELRANGETLEEAVRLARDFEDLRDEDRVILIDRERSLRRRETEEEELRLQMSHHEHQLQDVHRRRIRGIRAGLVGLAIGCGLVLLGLLAPQATSYGWWLRLLPGVIVGAAGGVFVLRVRRSGAAQESEARHRLELLERRRDELREQVEDANHRWEALCKRLNLDAEGLEVRYGRYRVIERQVDAVARLNARLAEARRQQQLALEDLGITAELFAQDPDPKRLDELMRLTRDALETHRRADADEAIADAARRKVEEQSAQLRRVEAELRRLLESLGVTADDETGLEEALHRLHRESNESRDLVHLRDRTLPELRAQTLSSDQRAELDGVRQQLMAQRDRMRAEIESVLGSAEDPGALQEEMAEPLEPARADREIRELEAEEQRRRVAEEEGRSAARAFLARYEIEAPRLRQSLEQHEAALLRAQRFAGAVRLALETLEEISRDTHRTWATALNRHASEFLERLGSNIERVSFDPKLQPVLVQAGRTLPASDAQQVLSVGALDGIYLAARLAVSAFLGRGRQPLPLILDDPFADLDDERLLAGMRLLLEVVAPRQQVLLMACQRSRYEWARDELGDPQQLITMGFELSEGGKPAARSRREGVDVPDDFMRSGES